MRPMIVPEEPSTPSAADWRGVQIERVVRWGPEAPADGARERLRCTTITVSPAGSPGYRIEIRDAARPGLSGATLTVDGLDSFLDRLAVVRAAAG